MGTILPYTLCLPNSDCLFMLNHAIFRRLTAAFILFCSLGGASAPTFAQPQAAPASIPVSSKAATPHVKAELLALENAVIAGKPITVALRFDIIAHWHTYWKNPGDSGLPTKIKWTLPEGFKAGSIEWAAPKKLPLGPLTNFGYENSVMHIVRITTPNTLPATGNITLKAAATWLVCHDVCIPEDAELAITLPIAAIAGTPTSSAPKSAKETANIALFNAAFAAIPAPNPNWKTTANITDKTLRLQFAPVTPPAILPTEISFYPDLEELILNAAPQKLSAANGVFTLEIPLATPVNTDAAAITGVVVANAAFGDKSAAATMVIDAPLTRTGAAAATAQPAPNTTTTPLAATAPQSSTGTTTLTLLSALFSAFLGGLILNLMPCVFPVLGIKVMGFLQHAQASTSLLRAQGWSFLAGVLVSFWILAGILVAVSATGSALGWGFQLQSPLFVLFLAALFVLLALNLAGVFEIGLGLQSAAGSVNVDASSGKKRKILTAAFVSGVLATIVATPCTAPFMGAALGFTIGAPAYVVFMVLTAVAIGMALPVVMLSWFPQWLKALPRPGVWMENLKQAMAFPLLATVAWLVWVLGSQLDNNAVLATLMGLVLLAVAAWCFGKLQARKPWLAIIVAAVFAAAGAYIAWPNAVENKTENTAKTADWEPYNKARIDTLIASGSPVFIDFTATWCISCQVNKKIALNTAEVDAAFQKNKVVRIKADWTKRDPEITAALASFGRNGVPLYVYYPKGANSKPVILPEVLTPSIVLDALKP